MSHEPDFMPDWAKWIANFIQRIGFPIVMCLILSYICFISLERNTHALIDLKEVMMAVRVTMEERGH